MTESAALPPQPSVERFRGNYFFLSNMYPLDVPIQSAIGLPVPTSEHAYQVAKFINPEDQYRVASLETGKETKAVAHELIASGAATRPDWDEVKVDIMRAIVTQKFRCNPALAERLLATNDDELVEGNDWGDRFWGVDPIGSRNGLNHMGRILMDVRDELRRESLDAS